MQDALAQALALQRELSLFEAPQFRPQLLFSSYSFCLDLTIGCLVMDEDLANTILHSTRYQEAIKANHVEAGRFLSVPAAEYLSGLPPNWTSPHAGACPRGAYAVEAQLKVVQFSSVEFLMCLNQPEPSNHRQFAATRQEGAGSTQRLKTISLFSGCGALDRGMASFGRLVLGCRQLPAPSFNSMTTAAVLASAGQNHVAHPWFLDRRKFT